jgi:heme exporter protein D
VNWSSASEFFAMGGYAFYVWGAYVVAAAVIAAELCLLRWRQRTMRRRLSRKFNAKQ